MPVSYNPNYAGQVSEAAQALPQSNLLSQQATGEGLSNQSQAMQNQLLQAALPFMLNTIQQQGNQTNDDSQTYNQPANLGIASGMGPTSAQPQVQAPQQQQQQGTAPQQSAQPSLVSTAYQQPNTPGQPGSNNTAEDIQPQGTPSQDAPQVANDTATTPSAAEELSARLNNHTDVWSAQFTPANTAMPANVLQQYTQAQILAGMFPQFKGYAEAIKTRWEQQIQQQNQEKARQASLVYRNAYAVAKSDPGLAREVLKAADPEEEKLLPATMTDDQIRKYATHVTASIFPYTGREAYIDEEGYQRDPQNKQRIPGYDTPVGLSQKEASELRTSGLQGVDAIAPDGGHVHIPRYLETDYNNWVATGAHGQFVPKIFPTVDAWFKAVAPHYGENASSSEQQGASSAPNQSNVGGQAFLSDLNKTGRTRDALKGPQPTVPTGGNVPVAKNSGQPAPQVPKYGLPEDETTPTVDMSKFKAAPQNPPGHDMKDVEGFQAAQKLQADKYQELQDRATQKLESANSGITDYTNVLHLLKQAAVGPGTEAARKIQNAFAEFTKNPSPGEFDSLTKNAAAGDALNKFLNQEGMQQAREKTSGMNDSMKWSGVAEQIALGKLSANTSLNRQAIAYIAKYELAKKMYDKMQYGQDFKAWDAIKPQRDANEYEKLYPLLKNPTDYLNNTVNNMDNLGNIRGNKPRSFIPSPGERTTPVRPNSAYSELPPVQDGFVRLKRPDGRTYDFKKGSPEAAAAATKGLVPVQ